MNIHWFLILTSMSTVKSKRNKIDIGSCASGKIDKCILKKSPRILAALRNGIPSLGIPSFHPYHIDNIPLPSVEFLGLVDSELNDVDVYGLLDAEVGDLRINFPKNHGFLELHFKLLTVSARYAINGTSWGESGNVIATIEGVTLEIGSNFRIENNLLELSDTNIDLHVEYFELNNSNDEKINEPKVWIMKEYISKNWKMLYKIYKEEIKVLTTNVTVPLLKKIGNMLLSNLP